jgi:cystinosin
VIGLSIDFQLLNILGFLSYTIYNSALYYSTVVREQYQAVHSGQLPAVHINDVAFSIHALVLSSISLTQCFLYRTTHNNNDDENFEENFEEENIVERTPQHHHHHKPATASLVAISIAVIISTIWAGVIFLTPTVDPPPTPCTWASKSSCPPESIFTWLTWLYFLSGIKFLVTLVKYMPQVVLNCQRQSTEGWNVWNVLLDFEGGVLSLAQQIIDAAVCQSLIPLIGSPIKFGLSLISMVFDVIFMVQHFVLYPDSKRKVAGEAMAADYTRLA